MTLRVWVIYGTTGALGAIVGLLRKRLRTLAYVGAVLIALAALNRYVETWNQSGLSHFLETEIVLLMIFLGAYSWFAAGLLREPLKKNLTQRLWASGSLFLYAWCLGLLVIAHVLKNDENPPFTMLVFLALVCVLHVPAFAAFNERFSVRGGPPAPQASQASCLFPVVLILVLSLAAAVVFQFSGSSDWRLLIPNAIISACISGLLLLTRTGSRPGRGPADSALKDK